jgi:hypothetical protein
MTGVSILIHGMSKSGKSYLADTSPSPRLILDAEGGASTRFTESVKKVWDPTQPPPEVDGTWDTAVVYVRSYQDVQRAYDWLNSGKHDFKSVVIDSLSETQQRCIDALVGTDQMKTQDWGDLLRKMSNLVRSYRDLIIHPTKPLDSVVFIAMTREVNSVRRPYVQGQLANTLPYYVDVCGYLWTELGEDGVQRRRLLCAPHSAFEAGDRTGKLGSVIDDPNIPAMLDMIYGNKYHVQSTTQKESEQQ